MSRPPAAVISRAVRGAARRYKKLRDTIEWRTTQALRHDSPWLQNRWGQRYQAISLSEYHYLRDGNPETYESALIERILRPGMTVVDVGANHGMFSLEAAHLVGPAGVVHAFEPTPSTRALLLRNISANELGNVKVFPFALGEGPGTAHLRVHREMTGLNTLGAHDVTWNGKVLPADEIVEVPITSLDRHAEAEDLDHIDFLKIDVEGFELGVIRGAAKLLRTQRVARIMLEIGDLTFLNAGVDCHEVLTELESLGYHLHRITPSGQVAERIRNFPAGGFSANFYAVPAT
jgi:FkbM family methyltransferase